MEITKPISAHKKNLILVVAAGVIARIAWSLLGEPFGGGVFISWITLGMSAISAAFLLRHFNIINYGFIAAFGCIAARYLIQLINIPSVKFVQWLVFIALFPTAFILMWGIFNLLRVAILYKLIVAILVLLVSALLLNPLIGDMVLQQNINRGFLP